MKALHFLFLSLLEYEFRLQFLWHWPKQSGQPEQGLVGIHIAQSLTFSEIFLSSECPLCNKLEALKLLLEKNTFHPILCFMETWLCGSILNSGLQLADVQDRSFWLSRGLGEYVFMSTVVGGTMWQWFGSIFLLETFICTANPYTSTPIQMS